MENKIYPWADQKWWQRLKSTDIIPWWQQFKLKAGKPSVDKLCPNCGAIKLRKVIDKDRSNFSIYFECTECRERYILTNKGLLNQKTYKDGRFKGDVN